MTVFELVHTYYTYKDEIYYSLRLLGFYKTKQDADAAINFYKTISGYCNAPNGFALRRREVTGSVENDVIWEALVYSHSFGYEDYEYTAELGLFASEAEAKNALKTYCNDNIDFLNNNPKMEIEKIVNWYKIGTRYCIEGFVVE